MTRTAESVAGPVAGPRRLLRAELRKALSTSGWWVLLAAAAVLAALLVLGIFLTGGGYHGIFLAYAMLAALIAFPKLAVVYGIICATGEFRWRTISTSYLSAPRRGRLLAAKLAAVTGIGAGYSIFLLLVGFLPWVVSGVDLVGLSVLAAVAVLTFALWSAFGVGLGMLVRNQTAAVVGVLVYLLVDDWFALAGNMSHSSGILIGDLLPGGSASATITMLADELTNTRFWSRAPMAWWLSLLIFTGYTGLVVLAGAAVARRRDVT